MTALIDTNLTLVYKNMVGLSNIVTDTSSNSYLIGSLSVNSNFNVSSSALLIGSGTINSYLNVSGNTIINNSSSLSSSLNVSGNTSINSSVSIYNSLNVTGNTTINNNLVISGISILSGPITYNSQLYVSGIANILNGINVDNINSNILNINASTINIGNYNSKININGTGTYIASSELLIVDKLISLNINSSTLQGVDIGMLSGIQIMGISSYGFIRTSADASRYQIQSPLLNAPTNYITVQDLNNNLIISGTSTLIGSSTIYSLFNTGGLIINSQTTINNSLNISGFAIINNSSTINNTLTISGYTNIDGGCSINSFLNISGLTNINNFASINSYLNISGLTNINGSVSVNSSLNVSGLTIINNSTSINSSLNISSSLIINAPISINSSLNVSSSTNIIGNGIINSNMMISNKSIFNNYTTINSSLNVSGSSTFNNGIAIQSTLGISGQIVAALPHYLYNIDAIYGGVPLWGFYRSGAIIKIRVDDPTAPPRIFFSSGSSISINKLNVQNLIDPGAYGIDSLFNSVSIYLTSLYSITSNNILTSNLLISGYSTLILPTNQITAGYYTGTYQATDLRGNINYNYKSFNIYNYYNASVFNVTNGVLTIPSPQMNYSKIAGNDWTFECYLYETAYQTSGSGSILDLRPYQVTAYPNELQIGLLNGYWRIHDISIIFSTRNTLNTWNHWVIMKQSNYLYNFLNGVMVQSININTSSVPTFFNNMSNCLGLTIGGVTDIPANYTGGGVPWHFNGSVSQIMLRLGAQYSISGFTPTDDFSVLANSSGSNTLIFIDNIGGKAVETISGITMTIFGTVPITYVNR